MSALEPVILGEVSKVSAAVAKLSAADSVLLDIPVRQGHSFSEGDIALYDTERGDLHDGRGEIIEYFSPPSGGSSYIAKTEQAPAVDLRQDGTILVAALFRSNNSAEGTASSSSTAMSLEVGYRKPDGQFVYTSAANLPNYLGYQIRDMRLIPISADEYFMVFFTNTSPNKYAHACSIRIVSGAPVIGAFTSSMNLGTSSYAPSFLLGVGSLYICIPDSTNPKTYRLVSSDGVITVSNPTVLLPESTSVYQIDASRILVMGSAPKLYRLAADSTPEVVDVTLDLSDFVNTPYYSPGSAFSIVKQGYALGKDIVNGIFCPLDNGTDRVYVSDTVIGGFTVNGTAVKVHPPYSDGGIGYDRIFYKGAIPTCAMHPVILAYTANSYVLPASFFMKDGLFLAASSASTIGSVSSSRTSVRSRYIDFGIVVARQSGKTAIAPIGAGGKVVARKYDQNLATKSAFFAIGVSGLLDVPEITTGRVRYHAATVTLTSPTSYDVNYMVPVVGPVNVQFLSLAPDAPSPGVKLWVCEDGVWSIKKVIKPTGGSLASIDASFAFKSATYFWDDVKLNASFKLNIGIYDGVVK